jgi:hypothetical protein
MAPVCFDQAINSPLAIGWLHFVQALANFDSIVFIGNGWLMVAGVRD